MVASGRGRHSTRRAVLAAWAATVFGGVAGCLGDTRVVRVLSAGSLARTFEEHISPAFE